MTYVLGRQYKDLKPAQAALRQPQAPHYAGLFALGMTSLSQISPACIMKTRQTSQVLICRHGNCKKPRAALVSLWI